MDCSVFSKDYSAMQIDGPPSEPLPQQLDSLRERQPPLLQSETVAPQQSSHFLRATPELLEREKGGGVLYLGKTDHSTHNSTITSETSGANNAIDPRSIVAVATSGSGSCSVAGRKLQRRETRVKRGQENIY